MRKLRYSLWTLLAIALCGGAFLYWNGALPQKGASVAAPRPVAGIKVGGPFTLTNHLGEAVTNENYAGKYLFVYFGFASCPAICPTELHKMTRALNGINAEQRAKIQPLFITIDPQRDTVEMLKGYMSLFHPDFVGLSGTDDQIKQVLKDWKVYAAKVDDPSLTEYTMDHSSYIYILSPQGDLLHLFRITDTAAQITEALAGLD